MKETITKLKVNLLLIVALPYLIYAQDQFNKNSQLYKSALETGNRVAANVAGRDEGSWYGAACAWYGLLIFSEIAGNQKHVETAKSKYKPYLDGTKKLPSGGKFPVDANIFGIWPLELYNQTKNNAYLEDGKYLADEEWNNPRNDGLTRYTRFWCDDLYMIGSLQIQTYQATKEQKYADRCANQIMAYVDSLQQEDDGLFRHAYNTQVHWGRANGWVASAFTEALMKLPSDHPRRPALLSAYQFMMNGLLIHQDPKGIWRQVIDKESSWLETSCSAMFLFALTTGIEKGWLKGAKFNNAVEKGFLALAEYVDANGRLTEICEGTEISPNESYYLARKRHIGDLHGQAPLLWAATAILRICNASTPIYFNIPPKKQNDAPAHVSLNKKYGSLQQFEIVNIRGQVKNHARYTSGLNLVVSPIDVNSHDQVFMTIK